nr:hypothetical protein [uncultured Sphingomonas sp.]
MGFDGSASTWKHLAKARASMSEQERQLACLELAKYQGDAA